MDWRANLTAYLEDRFPSAESVEIARVTGLPAGASNETVALDLRFVVEGRAFVLPVVLRPERSDGILAPYDVGRQFRVMRALYTTPVPVPAVFLFEDDRSALGTRFFLMERVRGETLPLFWYGGQTPRLAAAATALAAIHSVDWRAAGLEFLLPEGAATALEADLRPWRERATHARIEHSPLLVALGGFLARNEPRDARLVLLHGDPNPGNYLLDGSRVAAVVDWELAGVGDPRSDLGFYAALMTVFGGMPTTSGGTLLSDADSAITGGRLTDLDFYEGVGLYKMAIVMAGWVGRSGFGYGLDAIARRLAVLFGAEWRA